MKQSNLKIIAKKSIEKLLNAKENINYFKEPFKHIVIDDTNDKDIEIKYRSNWESEFDIPDGILPAIRIFNSSLFLNAMSKIIGINKIIPDAYFTGGGLNVTEADGLLDVHVDGNYHDSTGLNRRINAILYLNPGWSEGWGGEFGLYDKDGSNLVKKVAPIFNRLVIFDTHDKSYHGLPDPLNFPTGKNRKSIILYYYTKKPKDSNQITVDAPHSALWRKKGLKDKRGHKTRNFT